MGPYRRPLFRWLSLFGTLCLLLSPVACAASPPNPAWTSEDLRVLDPLDAPSPSTDILAVYTRRLDLSVEIRVDLLDINPGDEYLFKLVLWDDRDFSATPLSIDIFSNGMVQVAGIQTGGPVIWPRVIQDYEMDSITVSLNKALIGERFRLDVYSYTLNPPALADQALDVLSNGPPPKNSAALLLVFWNTFPATTPAQALRRWAGAHTGPLDGRHGLKFVLEGAMQSGVPVALLDLKDPAGLAALHFMGIIPEIKQMLTDNLLILPDYAFGSPAPTALELSRQSMLGFNVPSSQFIYALPADSSTYATLPGYRAAFASMADRSHLALSGEMRLIPLPSTDALQATEDGPSLDVRRSLISAALSPDPADLVVVGGSLPDSSWGAADQAGPTFDWIAGHPWIKPLTGQELLKFRAQVLPEQSTPAPVNSIWLSALQTAPDNSVTRSAWQVYLTLTAPTSDPQLEALNHAYLGQVGELLAAAEWAEHPTPRIDCTQDLNADGQTDCILANRTYFAILETAGARLTEFFSSDANGPHQWIGPSSQFALGLSDPSEWHPELGQAADPSVIPGAFTDDTETWTDYTPTLLPDGISFTSPDGNRVKTYRLTQSGLDVQYQGQGPVHTRIPLALDAQAFFYRPTTYQAGLGPHSWTWRLVGVDSLKLRTDAALSAQGFISALPYLSVLENPDLGYPQGIYLPFPLSLVTLSAEGNFSVQIDHRGW